MTRVLIIGDEPQLVDVLKMGLKANNFEVESAYDRPQALEILRSHKDIDVILVDIVMPQMDGIEFIRAIKDIRSDIQIIVMAGFASLDTAVEALKLGAYDYIKKPLEDIPALLRTIIAAVDKRRLIVDNERLIAELAASNEKLRKINLILEDYINELVMLHCATEAISGAISIDDIIRNSLKSLVGTMGFKRSCFFMYNEEQNRLDLKDCEGINSSEVSHLAVSIYDDTNNVVRCIHESRPVLLSDFQKDDYILSKITDAQSQSVMYYPMICRGQGMGVVVLVSDKKFQVTKMHSLQLYMRQVALSMENARMVNRLIKTNKDLRQTNSVKNEFISTVSHELRTPLTSIKEGVSIVLDRITGDINDKQEHVLQVAKDNADRLARLIEDLLDISQAEFGKIVLKRQRISVFDLIQKSVNSVKGIADSKDIAFKIDLEENLCDVFVDSDRIIQVMVNLLSNAIKFSSHGSSIAILAKKTEADGFISVSVRDEGIGIAQSDMGKLFEKFSQIDKFHGAGKRGTGLGLAISKELILMHNGKIWLEKTIAGKGSIFMFTMPIYEEGIEGQIIFGDYIDSQIKREHRMRGNFSILGIRFSDDINKNFIAKVEEDIRKILPSEDDRVVLFSERFLLCFLVDMPKISAINWKDHLINIIPRQVSAKMYSKIVTYPEDGDTREELLKRAVNFKI